MYAYLLLPSLFQILSLCLCLSVCLSVSDFRVYRGCRTYPVPLMTNEDIDNISIPGFTTTRAEGDSDKAQSWLWGVYVRQRQLANDVRRAVDDRMGRLLVAEVWLLATSFRPFCFLHISVTLVYVPGPGWKTAAKNNLKF